MLAGGYVLAPPLGTDLSAQVARADFFAGHGWAVLDFGWYGGVSPYGYSLLSPPLMAWLGGGLTGPKLLGALALLGSTVAFAALLARTGATRPVLGGVLAAVCFAGNLVSGRTTYALGVFFGLLALLALTSDRRWVRVGGTVAGAALAGAASPVAGMFTGLVGAAWALSGLAVGGGRVRAVDRRRLADGARLIGGAAVPVLVMGLVFGSGGWMNISGWDAARAAGAGLLVLLLVPVPAIRIGAALSVLLVLGAFVMPTPVGLNATRLAAMFALPVLAAYVRLPGVAARSSVTRAAAVAGVLVAVGLWQPPVSTGDLRAAGDPAASAAYFAPLRAELSRRAPVGRVEVVPLANYWDAAHVSEAVPLARGWLRQADLAHNPIFFDGTLTPGRYEDWLRDNGVTYVALADAEPSWVGRAEAELIRAGVPFVTPVWRGGAWTLYEVSGRPSIVSGATLLASTRGGVTLAVDRPGDVLVRVRWSRWLAVRGPSGACLARSGDWITLRTTRPGNYEITGTRLDRGPFCPVSHAGQPYRRGAIPDE